MEELVLERVPTVLGAQEVLDKAFQRSLKIDVPDPVRYHRIRKTEAARMACVVDVIADTLMRYPNAFPNMDNLRDYNLELLDIVVGLPRLKKALGSVRWAAQKVRDVGQQSAEAMRRQRTVEGIKRVQNRCYGRVSSITYEVDPDLEFLREARDRVRVLPTINPGFATVVIAGYPNVGKSSLLRAWTQSRAEVNDYAFTTKHAEVGHLETRNKRGEIVTVQVVDTPGLLDRPDTERNEVERQAVAALRHAADAVLFLIDPTENSGFGRAEQDRLLEQVTHEMAGMPLLVAHSKADVWRDPESDRLAFSTVSGEGMASLREAVLGMLPIDDEPELEEDPLERWLRGGKSS